MFVFEIVYIGFNWRFKISICFSRNLFVFEFIFSFFAYMLLIFLWSHCLITQHTIADNML